MMRTLFTLSVTCLLTFAAECLRADTCVVDGVEWSYTVERGKAKIGDLRSRAIPSSTKGSLVIPSELGGVPVTSIEYGAFLGCCGLTSVMIPSSVRSLSEYAFGGCVNLKSFLVDPANPNYSSVNGLLCSKDGRILIAGINGDVTIPSSVTRIGSFAFEGRESLTSVEIPLSVTNIGFGAFQECPLKKVLVAKGDEDRVKKLLKKSGGLDVSGLKFGEMSAP